MNEQSAGPTQLMCPSCAGKFLVARTPPRTHVVCPHCEQVVVVDRARGRALTAAFEPPPSQRVAVAIPQPPAPTELACTPDRDSTVDGTFAVPTDDGELVRLREPVKTVRSGRRLIRLRQLSADEKRRRRVRRNVIMWFLGATILIITATVLGNL